ncbi:MAG: hypothetical protein ACYC4T_13075, partial [Melioribacteraceae bacterium]
MKAKLRFYIYIIIIQLLFSNFSFSQIQWDSSFPLDVYYLYRFKFVFPNNNTIMAGTNDGLYYSTNGGSYWQKDYNSFAQVGIWNLIQDKFGNLYLTTSSQAFIYKISDGKWHNVVANLNPGNDGLALNSLNHLFLWSGGLYKTTDMGTTWLPINGSLTGTFNKIFIDKNDKIYVGMSNGLYQSNNNGFTFQKISDLAIKDLIITKSSTIFIVTASDNYLFRSMDEGLSWTLLLFSGDKKINTIYELKDGSILVGTSGGVFYSSDNGNNWTFTGGLPALYSIADLAVDSKGTVFAGCFNKGIIKGQYSQIAVMPSPDLVSPNNNANGINVRPTLSWSSVNNAISYRLQVSTNANFSSTIFDQSGIISTSQSISGLSHNTLYYWRVNATDGINTSDWSEVWSFTTQQDISSQWQSTNWPSQNLGIQAIATNSQNHVFVCTSTDGIYRSTDLGNTWSKLNNGLSFNNIACISIDEYDRIFIGTHGDGVYFSNNNGNSWNKIGLGTAHINKIYALNNYVFAGDGYACTGVYRTSDLGNTWTNVQNGLGACTGNVIVTNSGLVYGGSGIEGMYKSNDYGSTWQQINNGLTSTNISTMVVDNSGNVFVGTQTNIYTGTQGRGLFRTTNDGDSWENLTNGITTNEISQLSISSDGILFTS